ncbi:hypothetical protein GCM10010151_04750 [Actinoallomurus spadix]|uniref:Uncharacterized protein n=1 Tax=Actinoallomurus spadix TaxID=79912 RepID=A0ABP3FH63_9ACTN
MTAVVLQRPAPGSATQVGRGSRAVRQAGGDPPGPGMGRDDAAGDRGGRVDVSADGHAGAHGPLVVGEMTDRGPQAEWNGVRGEDAGPVAEFVRGLLAGPAEQPGRPADAVVHGPARSVLEDGVQQPVGVTAHGVRGRDGDGDRAGDALGVRVRDDGRGGRLQRGAFEVTGVVGAEGSDAHGGPVAHRSPAAELGGGGRTPGLAVAQRAQEDDSARPVPAVGVVTRREGGGEGVPVHLAVPAQDVEEVAGHLGVVRPRPRAGRHRRLVEEQRPVLGGEELGAERVADGEPGEGGESDHRPSR